MPEQPTELETFRILEEAQKTLKLAMDPDYSKFMNGCIGGGKSAGACQIEWNNTHTKPALSTEMQEYVDFIQSKMKEGKSLKDSVDMWKAAQTPPAPPAAPGNVALEPVMSRLEALENIRKEEIKVQLSGLVTEVKKIDPTFDDKTFLAPYDKDMSAGIRAINTYMAAIKHFRETPPEPGGGMHMPSDSMIAKRKEALKHLFGSDDIAKVVKEL